MIKLQSVQPNQEKSPEKKSTALISFTQLLQARLPSSFLFYFHVYEDFRTYQRLKNTGHFYAAVTLFFQLVGRLVHSGKQEITIPADAWSRLQALYQGDLSKEFLAHIHPDLIPLPFAVAIYDAQLVQRTTELGVTLAYTRGGGGTPVQYENWNEIWVFLQKEANPILFQLEMIIQQILENNLMKKVRDGDNI